MLWAGLNFVHPEVRQHRLDFIERTAAAHDFDGYELDFNRMGISFPLGQERQNAHLLTELVREARQRLDAVGQRRGRPYTLAVHVVDSLERSQELGMEVERWVREGLVDVLLVGMGHLPSRLRLDQFVSLGRAHGVPVYATLNGNSYRAGAWEGLYGRPVFREGMRASAAYYHQEGAAGIYLFNYANEPTQELSREEFISALSELGEAETLAGKNKVYGIHSTAHTGGPIIQGSESALLPVVLDRVETKLPLQMGPDADDENARFRISLWTAESREDTHLWVRLNHTLLPTRRSGRSPGITWTSPPGSCAAAPTSWASCRTSRREVRSPESSLLPASRGRTGWVGNGMRGPWWTSSPRAGWCGIRVRKAETNRRKGVP